MKPLLLLCLLSPWLGTASAQGVVTVEEGADAVLPCRSNSAVEEFDWKKDGDTEVFLYEGGSHNNQTQNEQFQGRVFFFRDELKNGNASIKIHSTKLEDNGTYICVLDFFNNPRRESIRLNVDGVLTIRNVFGAALEPGFNKLNGTEDWSLLECKTIGVPKPEVVWRNSFGNVLPPKELKVTEKDRRFHVTSKLNVTKTGHYTCVATQKEILHQIHNTIFETFKAKDNSAVPALSSAVAVLSIFLVV